MPDNQQWTSSNSQACRCGTGGGPCLPALLLHKFCPLPSLSSLLAAQLNTRLVQETSRCTRCELLFLGSRGRHSILTRYSFIEQAQHATQLLIPEELHQRPQTRDCWSTTSGRARRIEQELLSRGSWPLLKDHGKPHCCARALTLPQPFPHFSSNQRSSATIKKFDRILSSGTSGPAAADSSLRGAISSRR